MLPVSPRVRAMQRLKTRPQFQAALAGRILSKTAHFALHGCTLPPTAGQPGSDEPRRAQALFSSVDIWLGAMVPKRWARRAATRNLIKRQIYTIGAERVHALAQGAHVVRLRSAFPRSDYPSAASDALKEVVRQELLQLLAAPQRVVPGPHEVGA